MTYMKWLIKLFTRTKPQYLPVSQWLIQGEHGWHDSDWSRR